MPKHRAGHSAVMLARRYLVVCFGMDMKSRASSEAYLIDCKPEEKIEPRVREAKVYPPVSSDGPSASSAAEILNFAEDNGPGGLQEEEEAVENATQDRTLHMEDISDTAVVKMSGPSQAEHFKNVLRRICSEIQKGGNFFDLVNMMGEAGILTASQGRKLLFLANQCDTRVLQAFTALENTPGEERTLDMIKVSFPLRSLPPFTALLPPLSHSCRSAGANHGDMLHRQGAQRPVQSPAPRRTKLVNRRLNKQATLHVCNVSSHGRGHGGYSALYAHTRETLFDWR
eukprot:767633-Hanusia_phi.AAC.7